MISMAYTKQGFENGQVLNDTNLIKIEDGIIDLQEDLDDIVPITESEIDNICT